MISLEEAFRRASNDLLNARNDAGHWDGELAASALSTATAVSALRMFRKHEPTQTVARIDELISRAIRWLEPQQNADGGWGDTDKSYSNISTTMLVKAAYFLTGVADTHADALARADTYVQQQGGIAGLRQRYGKDKTFAVPILTNCALAGLVDWSEVARLPFELACLPQSFYRFVRLPVVSYAIPALVAVGQVIHANRKSWNPITFVIRNASIGRSLDVLLKMLPASGGYLEAIPLTSFVVMSLIGAGQGDHPVVLAGVRFLLDTAREDGSWPIDTNLATWNTTLALNALGDAAPAKPQCWDWIRSCQNTERHPFTGADPGGWGWSDLSGAVPDADDTPSALIALRRHYDRTPDAQLKTELLAVAKSGSAWLCGLQNRDGGWPTFCRGWGTLPFDRSGSDLTAHAIRALWRWRDEIDTPANAIRRGFAYLSEQQRADGSWYPLWFGNQDHADEENPVYGTAKVLLAYHDVGRMDDLEARQGIDWLIRAQLPDGGWNAGFAAPDGDSQRQKVETTGMQPFSIVEETALAVEALLSDNTRGSQNAALRGVDWLVEAVCHGRHLDPTPIGFYFAKLWYYERLYPLIFTVSALRVAVERAGEMSATHTSANP